MQGIEIIDKLVQVIPSYTTKFSYNETVASAGLELSPNKLVLTLDNAITGLKVDNNLKLNNIYAVQNLTITSLGANVYTFETTKANQVYKDQKQVTIIDENDNTVTIDIISLDSLTSFKGKAQSTLDLGLAWQLMDRRAGLNTVFQVKEINGAELKFDLPTTLTIDGVKAVSGTVDGAYRIKEQAISANFLEPLIQNESTTSDELNWNSTLFIVTGGLEADQDNSTFSNSPVQLGAGTDKHVRFTQDFSIFFIEKTGNDASNLEAKYFADELRPMLYKALVGSKVESGFNGTNYQIAPTGDLPYESTRAYYIHEFTFNTQFEIEQSDCYEPQDTITLVNIAGGFKTPFDDFEEEKKTLEINAL